MYICGNVVIHYTVYEIIRITSEYVFYMLDTRCCVNFIVTFWLVGSHIGRDAVNNVIGSTNVTIPDHYSATLYEKKYACIKRV